jgi:beta-galactosidase GanA
LATPKNGEKYAVIPYSNKINFALDNTDADLICYLDNGSMPHRKKYQIMAKTLEENPTWGAVYCSQHRTGFQDMVHLAEEPIPDPYAKVNYTQAMHRKTDKRWTLDMQYATPNDLADALFWQSLDTTFYPVPTEEILDVHNMESQKASGV